MKKLSTLLVLIVLVSGKSFAQGEANDKKFRFGLKAIPSLNWYSPDDKKKFESNGVGFQFGWGLQADFRLTENIWLGTGIEMNSDGGKIKFSENTSNKAIGYFLKNNEITSYDYNAKKSEGSFSADTSMGNSEWVKLSERRYKVSYVSLPLLLKMKTNEIGYMTYFGQFGVTTHIRTKARAFDDGNAYVSPYSTAKPANSPSLTELDISSELQPVRVNLVVGLGTEYNLSGTTSLFFSCNFNYGISNAVKKQSTHLVDATIGNLDSNGNFKAYEPQKFIPLAVGLTVGILF